MEKSVEEIIEQNVKKLSDPGRNNPEILDKSIHSDLYTELKVCYNNHTGEISYPGTVSKGGLPGVPFGGHRVETSSQDTDPKFFSEATVKRRYGNENVPYELVSVQRLGPNQFSFGMAPGDQVIEKTIEAYNLQREGE